MKRVKYERPADLRSIENAVLQKAEIDSSGMIIYPGREPVESRTGSPIRLLINYLLYHEGTKPLDAEMFASHLVNDLKIGLPAMKTKWKRWTK